MEEPNDMAYSAVHALMIFSFVASILLPLLLYFNSRVYICLRNFTQELRNFSLTLFAYALFTFSY